MAGEYRNEATLAKLPPDIAELLRGNIRIAVYDGRPILGCIPRHDLIQQLAEAYYAIGEYGFTMRLINREILPVELPGATGASTPQQRYYAPGELFFTT